MASVFGEKVKRQGVKVKCDSTESKVYKFFHKIFTTTPLTNTKCNAL